MKSLKRATRLLVCFILVVSVLISVTGCSGLGNLFREILPDYLTINLDNATLLSESENNEQIYTYRIDAAITNHYAENLDKLMIRLNAPSNVEVTKDGEKAQKEVSLAINETITLQWIVKIPMTDENQNIDYSVSAISSKIKPIEAYASMFVKGKNKNDNRLDFSKDTWNFKNFSTKPVCLTQEDYNALIVGLDNADVEYLYEQIVKGSNGYCYGFAASSILAKMGVLKASEINGSSDNIHDIEKNKTSKSLLAYYWLTQFFPCVTNERAEFNRKTIEEKIQIVEEKAKAVESGGCPFIFSFYTDIGGHAVVAYSYEQGSFFKKGRAYDSRILIYDSNKPKWNENSCLYYNAGTTEWCIPNYNASDITRALSDINIMNVKNVMNNRKSANSYLSVKDTDQFSISDAYGNILATVDGTKVSGNNEIVAYYLDGTDDEIEVAIPKKETEQGFTVKSNEDDDLEISVKYDNFYIAAETDSGNSITFDPNGSARINGKASDFKMDITANEGYHSTDWHTIRIEGESGENPQVSVNNRGYFLSGNDLKKINVYAENGKTAQKLTIKAADSPVMLSQDGKNLNAKTDTNADGEYETVLTVGKSVEPQNPIKGHSFGWKWIPIVIGGIVAVCGLTLLIAKLCGTKKSKRQAKKKNKRKKNSDDDWWM